MDLWFTETETKNLNEFNKSFGLLQSIAFNLVNNSNIYKKFHFKIIKICSQMAKTEKETRRRSSSFSMEVSFYLHMLLETGMVKLLSSLSYSRSSISHYQDSTKNINDLQFT